MHERLFANQRALEPFTAHAEALGLDVPKFEECMNSEKYAALVRKDMAEAGKAGATGTPSFVVALTDPENPSQVKGVSFIRGAQPFQAFQVQLDQALAEAAKGAEGGNPSK